MRPNLPSSALLSALLCALPSPRAWADAPVLTAGVSGSTALVDGTPVTDADRIPITTSQQNGSNMAQASGEGQQVVSYHDHDPNFTGFASAYARGSALAAPGVVRVYGSVVSNASVGRNVVFSDLTVPSTYNVSSQLSAGASFSDTVTIDGAGMAIGTPVRLPIHFLAELTTNYSLGYPVYSPHALSAAVSFTVPGLPQQNFNTEVGSWLWNKTYGPGVATWRVGSDDGSLFVDLHVGDVLPIGATFGITGNANINDLYRLTSDGGYVDARDTAGVWFGTPPAGVTISSASGHDYTIDPRTIGVAAPVPEADTWAMLLTGLVAAAVVLRLSRARRRSPSPSPRHCPC